MSASLQVDYQAFKSWEQGAAGVADCLRALEELLDQAALPATLTIQRTANSFAPLVLGEDGHCDPPECPTGCDGRGRLAPGTYTLNVKGLRDFVVHMRTRAELLRDTMRLTTVTPPSSTPEAAAREAAQG